MSDTTPSFIEEEVNIVDTAVSSMVPPIPVDVLGVVAECLAGMHAFRTLASLNVMNHETHHTTLPVLYETLLLDLRYDIGWTFDYDSQNLPKGSRFTRFLLCHGSGSLASATIDQLRSMFPRLATVLTIDGPGGPSHAFRIRLCRPLRRSLLFGMLCDTPIYHLRSDGSGASPASAIHRITLEADGKVLPDSSADGIQNCPVTIRFDDTCFVDLTDKRDAVNAWVDNVVNVMQAVGEQQHERRSARITAVGTLRSGEDGEQSHLALLVHRSELQALIDKLSQVAPANPKALCARIRFFLHDTPTSEFLANVLQRLKIMHEESSPYRTRPSIPSPICLYIIRPASTIRTHEDDFSEPRSAYGGEVFRAQGGGREPEGQLWLSRGDDGILSLRIDMDPPRRLQLSF